MVWIYFISFVVALISAEDTHAKHYLDQTMPMLPISTALVLVMTPGVNTLYALWYFLVSIKDVMLGGPIVLDAFKDTRGDDDVLYP